MTPANPMPRHPHMRSLTSPAAPSPRIVIRANLVL